MEKFGDRSQFLGIRCKSENMVEQKTGKIDFSRRTPAKFCLVANGLD